MKSSDSDYELQRQYELHEEGEITDYNENIKIKIEGVGKVRGHGRVYRERSNKVREN